MSDCMVEAIWQRSNTMHNLSYYLYTPNIYLPVRFDMTVICLCRGELIGIIHVLIEIMASLTSSTPSTRSGHRLIVGLSHDTIIGAFG